MPLCSGSDDLMPPGQTLPLGKQELSRRLRLTSRGHHRRRLSASFSSSGGDGDRDGGVTADANAEDDYDEAQDRVSHPLPPPPHSASLYRTLRRCRPCAHCDDPDDAFASFDTGREAILPVGCTSTQTFTSTTSTKKTTTSSINQSRKTTSTTTDHHLHSSPAWHADCSR